MRILLSLIFAAGCAVVQAADYSWVDTRPGEQQLDKLSEDDRRRVMDDIIRMQQVAKGAPNTAEGKRALEWAAKSKRRMDQLASEEGEANRKNLKASVGLSPDEPSGIFYLLSWSMPIEMLRAYVLEAHWAGGSIVFRGIPPDKKLTEHIFKDYLQLSRKEAGLDAPITIDPRMYDMFSVDAVPAIVLVDEVGDLDCVSTTPTPVGNPARKVTVRKCEASKDKWWKVTGGVTTPYALELMAQAGAKTATFRLEKYRAAASGKPQARVGNDGKSLQPYTGKWEPALTESDLRTPKEGSGAKRLN